MLPAKNRQEARTASRHAIVSHACWCNVEISIIDVVVRDV